MALHPSAVLITAANGQLTAWDLLAGAERLRIVRLRNPDLPGAAATACGPASTNHVMLLGESMGARQGRKGVQAPLSTEE